MNKKLFRMALCATILLAGTARADVIGMRTRKAAPEQLTLALNAGVTAQLDWSGGGTQTLTFDGTEKSIPIEGDSLTITTVQTPTLLYCPDNGLTQLNVDGAPSLQQIYCPDNELTAINLTNLALLEELDCSNNRIAALSLTKNPNLVSLDCADNALTTLYTTYQTKLLFLNCAGNKINKLAVSATSQLETLWCQDNGMTGLTIGAGVDPVQVCAFNNAIPKMDFTGRTRLQELWADNNQLATLDLSTCSVRKLSVSNNELTLIKHNASDKKSMTDFYVDGNALAPISFVTVYNATTGDSLMNFAIAPQRPFYITDKVEINETIDMTDFTRLNGWGVLAGFTINWVRDEDGVVLTKGTDYKLSVAKYTFLTDQKAIHAEGTSTKYPGWELRSQSFQVGNPTGIVSIDAAAGTQIYARGGGLIVSTGSPMQLQVYDVCGRSVINQPVAAGTHTFALPAGIYIAAGVKVIINH